MTQKVIVTLVLWLIVFSIAMVIGNFIIGLLLGIIGGQITMIMWADKLFR